MRRILQIVGAAMAVSVLAVGCAPIPGAPATWGVVAPYPLATSTSLTIAVTRESCAGGRTGKPLTPRVTYEDQQIVIVAEVEPLIGKGARTCQNNDSVQVVVELEEPIGHRDLVDGSCLNNGLEGPIVRGSSCAESIRWPAH